MKALQLQHFDTEIFGVPFYRVVLFDMPLLEAELPEICGSAPLIVDAKIDACNKTLDHFFQTKGFKKVCTQLAMELAADDAVPAAGEAAVSVLSLPDPVIKQHAENFTCDRFSLDVRISAQQKNRLYETWVRNSLVNPDIKIICRGNDFCSFKEKNDGAVIDLLSVLEKRKRTGSRLLQGLKSYSRSKGLKKISVITECENRAGFFCYTQNGFSVSRFLSCFHYVK